MLRWNCNSSQWMASKNTRLKGTCSQEESAAQTKGTLPTTYSMKRATTTAQKRRDGIEAANFCEAPESKVFFDRHELFYNNQKEQRCWCKPCRRVVWGGDVAQGSIRRMPMALLTGLVLMRETLPKLRHILVYDCYWIPLQHLVQQKACSTNELLIKFIAKRMDVVDMQRCWCCTGNYMCATSKT